MFVNFVFFLTVRLVLDCLIIRRMLLYIYIYIKINVVSAIKKFQISVQYVRTLVL